MYLKHFNLSCRPFEETPDHRFLYMSPQHARALANIEYAITTRNSFVVISGEIGMGKTTLLNNVLAEMKKDVSVARVAHTTLSPTELLQMLLAEFGIRAYEDNKVYLLERLGEYFADQKAAGRRIAILVDEAQNLTIGALEELRMLSSTNLELSGLISVVLVGQPELNTLLDSPRLEQLRQRVRLRQHLMPLTREETEAYIDRRLQVADSSAQALLTPEAIEQVYEQTGGIPRLINTLCEAAFTSAWADEADKVDAARIALVADELGWRNRKRGRADMDTGDTGSHRRPPNLSNLDSARPVHGWLRCINDDDEVWVPVTALPFSIGRTSGNSMQLRNPHISRVHAVIDKIDGKIIIVDQDSRNGTYVNRRRVENTPLRDGDRISLGNVEIDFQLPVAEPVVSAS
jgi:type II secretory pathway predicted ATPase ExeA